MAVVAVVAAVVTAARAATAAAIARPVPKAASAKAGPSPNSRRPS
jgi:hypothetical protein